MKLYHTLCLLACLFCYQCAGGQENNNPLPSLNYWELTLDLVMRADFADSLEVSPDQINKINEMRNRKDLNEVIERRALELRLNGDRTLSDVLLTLDDLIRAELNKILLPDQVAMLKVVKLRAKFPKGYLPFWDREVQSLFRLSKEQRTAFMEMSEKVKARFEQEYKASIDRRARKIVDGLQLDAQRRFVVLVGNDYLPGIPIRSDDPFDLQLFPPQFKSLGTIDKICRDDQYQALLGLRTDQINALRVVGEECDLSRFREQTQYKSMFQFGNAMIDFGFQQVSLVLTNDQMMQAARMHAAAEFSQNPLSTFSRNPLIAYVMLSKEQTDSIRSTIHSENARHDALVRKLNRSAFDEITNSLPDYAQHKLKQAFYKVWD